MQREKIRIYLSWALAIICMGVIFWLSSRTAEESSQQSGIILQWLIKVFGDNGFTDFIVRKLAHFLEFTGLCFLVSNALYQTRGRLSPVIATVITSIYAVSDEVHQIFVPGRACQLMDWVIDTCGAVLGCVIFFLLLTLVRKVSKKPIDTEDN